MTFTGHLVPPAQPRQKPPRLFQYGYPQTLNVLLDSTLDTILYYTVLYCIILYYNILYYTILYIFLLYYIIWSLWERLWTTCLAVPQPFLLAVCTSAHSTFMSSRVASSQAVPQFIFASIGMLTCELRRTHTLRHQLRQSQETLWGYVEVREVATKRATNLTETSRNVASWFFHIHCIPWHTSSATLKTEQATCLL